MNKNCTNVSKVSSNASLRWYLINSPYLSFTAQYHPVVELDRTNLSIIKPYLSKWFYLYLYFYSYTHGYIYWRMYSNKTPVQYGSPVPRIQLSNTYKYIHIYNYLIFLLIDIFNICNHVNNKNCILWKIWNILILCNKKITF